MRQRRAIGWWVAALSSVSCSGPAASDGALCIDVVQRLCAAPRCEAVDEAFSLSDASDCVATLTASSGCGTAGFTFVSPSRTRVLDCRLLLIHEGDSVAAYPSCEDVVDFLERCGDVQAFLLGVK